MAKSPEERLESKVIRDLRKRLLKAENENRRLRKQCRELEQVAYKNPFDDEEDKILETEAPRQRETSRPDFFCPKCKEPVTNRFVLRGVTEHFKCEHCGAKGRVQ